MMQTGSPASPLDLFQYAAAMGVGGILAWAMFLIYRKDALNLIAQWRGQSEELLRVVKENTSAITAMRTLLERRGDDHDHEREEGRSRG